MAMDEPFDPLVANRNWGCIRALIDAGADANVKDSKSNTILHWIIIDGGINYSEHSVKPEDFIPLLVEAGARLEKVNHRGFTPLMWAIVDSGLDYVRALLDAGANPNAIVPDNGKTAYSDGQNLLSLAVWHHYPLEVMRALLDAGADVNLRDAHGRASLEYLQAVVNEYLGSARHNSFLTKYLECNEMLQVRP